MEKKNIAILFGGCSPEYSVSLQSAAAVAAAIDKNRYRPILVGITPAGDWYRFSGSPEKIRKNTWCNPADCRPALLSPNRSARSLLEFHAGRVEKTPLAAVFPVLHGKNGEDGTVQGGVELAGLPLVGCGTLASALAMDKERAHRLVRAAGMPVPKGIKLQKGADPAAALALAASLTYPIFVKPVRAGSSYGITRVTRREGLVAAIQLAFDYDAEVIIEEAVDGFEVGCAVIGNEELTVGEIDEIELAGGFFDFKEKYSLKTAVIHLPARLPHEKAEVIKETARIIYRTLGCRGFARVDLFLNSQGELIFNEVNTIPGFTPQSRFPRMMQAAGFSFEEVISRVITLALGA